jgi:4-aminobutyrate aminotransferase
MEKKAVIKVPVPGPKAREIVERDTMYLATGTKSAPIVAKKGLGVVVEDVDGNSFLDFTSGAGVINTGHCHPKVVKAIQQQAAELIHFAGTDFYYDVQVKLAEKLVKITPGKFEKRLFYTNSGAESIEAAFKLARWTSGRKQNIAFIGAFHGRTMGALSLTASKPVHKDRYFPTVPGVNHLPYAYCYRCAYKLEYPKCDMWCAKILEEVYFQAHLPPQEVAAIFMEPIQGEGGYVVPPREFARELRKICNRHGILFVDDEVQAGFGRTGKWFCIEHYGVEPDMITLAKGIASGMPMGAMVFRKELDWKVQGAHSNTYGGNPVACAAALATIDVIEGEKLMENAKKMGDYLHKRLLELQQKHMCIGDVRGIGLMQATEFVKDRKTREVATELRNNIEEIAWKNGLMLLGCGRTTIRYIPPLVVTRDQIDQAMDILDLSIRKAVEK